LNAIVAELQAQLAAEKEAEYNKAMEERKILLRLRQIVEK